MPEMVGAGQGGEAMATATQLPERERGDASERERGVSRGGSVRLNWYAGFDRLV
jgi:hypothetical protein